MSEELNCSDGAKMLIDQMKEHPEEFKGFAGKFTHMLDTATEVVRGNHRAMSKRDAIAILATAEEHLYEVWLAEEVLTKMMAPKPELEEDAQRAYNVGLGRGRGKSVLQGGVLTANPIANIANIASNTASNTNIQQYVDQVYRMEKERYALAMEQRDREALKRQENEHAMRSTKPFKGFL